MGWHTAGTSAPAITAVPATTPAPKPLRFLDLGGWNGPTTSVRHRHGIGTISVRYRYGIGTASVWHRYGVGTVPARRRYGAGAASAVHRYGVGTGSAVHRPVHRLFICRSSESPDLRSGPLWFGSKPGRWELRAHISPADDLLWFVQLCTRKVRGGVYQ